jgi:O-methyltransferase
MNADRATSAKVKDPSLAYGIRHLLLRTPIRKLFSHEYLYMFTPTQLGFLCDQVTGTAAVPGSILEVGCAFGATTVFLNRHIDSLGLDVNYYAIDTFRGFTAEDISYERQVGRDYRYNEFRANSKATFDRTMHGNGIERVTSFRADASNFDYSELAPFRLVLVDVDLYQPVLAVLNSIYDLMSPGGVIVTDDCMPGGQWGGAYDAYAEFTQAECLDSVILHDKLGLVIKH